LKGLNDKWIAGGNFTDKTLFEDMLFLDRASRNIGDIIYLDIFDLKEVLNRDAINEAMDVYSFIASIFPHANLYPVDEKPPPANKETTSNNISWLFLCTKSIVYFFILMLLFL
jgi:hypothetical protein